MSTSAAGRRMRISRATAVRWAATWRKQGHAEALPMGGDRRFEPLEAHAPEIPGWLEKRPDLFLREIVSRLADAGVETSAMRVAPLLVRHGITRTKTVVAAEQAREDIAPARSEWRDGMTALAPENIVFIDESGFGTKMTRRFGRTKCRRCLAWPLAQQHVHRGPAQRPDRCSDTDRGRNGR
jgi:transposase